MITTAETIALYGALAGVAAITTAIQSLVALQPLREALDISRRKDSLQPVQSEYKDVRHEARTKFFVYLLLNLLAAGINGSVLAAWWKAGAVNLSSGPWEYWLPWVAVVAASGILFLTAAFSIIWLGCLAWTD